MLDHAGFDLWADGYDESVGLSDESDTYPFAGYKAVLNNIYRQIRQQKSPDVLDIGFGTGTLTAKLYEQGCRIWGQDFSGRMIKLARAKMPQAKLVQGDFTDGLAKELQSQKYDAIVATYSLHHLTPERQIDFLKELLSLLKEDGKIFIGDVAFQTAADLAECREEAGDEWDAEEFYPVFDRIETAFPGKVSFQKHSRCAGVLTLEK